jgi:putative addiction module component (TIGR02574 family)
MTDTNAKLLAEAMSLPEEDREEIAVHLWESLGPPGSEMSEEEWDAEIRRRVEEVDSGKVQCIPWEEAMRIITEDLDKADDTLIPPAGPQ